MESQRYPDDYDGIVGGAAGEQPHRGSRQHPMEFRREREDPGILPARSRTIAAFSSGNECMRRSRWGEGRGDHRSRANVISTPRLSQCKSAGQENCLTASQVETAKQIYAGPVNPRTGQSLYPGLPRGSEFGWDGLDPNPGGNPPYAPIFQWVFGPQWDWRQFDFDHDDAAYTQKLAGMVNATSPDIDTFRAHGHKLLMYHGWSDWLVAPEESINYYNAVLTREPPLAPANPMLLSISRSVCSWSRAWRIVQAVPGRRISMH